MEKREILIASTRTQKQYKVNTDATTLAELKAAIDANEEVTVKNSEGNWVANNEPIDYNGLSFTESLTRTQFIDDAAQLPQNVNYKGQVTNNLVMLLTNTQKNVASGEGSRKEAYEIIKANNLQEDIKEEFGCNYTNVSTADLWAYIDANTDAGLRDEETDDDDFDDDYDDEDDTYESPVNYTPTGEDVLMEIYDLIKMLQKVGTISRKDINVFQDLLEDFVQAIKETEAGNVKVGNIEVDLDELLADI